MKKKRTKIAIPTEVWEQVQNQPTQIEQAKSKTIETKSIVELVLKKDAKTNIVQPLNLKQLQTRINKIQAAVTKKYKDNEHLDHRPPIFLQSNHFFIDEQKLRKRERKPFG